MKTILFAVGASLVLGACTGAEWNSINRQFDPGTGDSRLIDAKQRAIISVVDPLSGEYRGTCAEPSPDALQATATALAGAGGASNAQAEAFLNLAVNNSESAASIGLRTQSIQLLRDAYYRLCEGRVSGYLDNIAFDILQRRFQNHMIALLAVEQLTGAVVAAQAKLGSSGTADAGAQAGAVLAAFREAQGTADQLAAEQSRLNAQLDTLSQQRRAATDPAQQAALDAQIANTNAALDRVSAQFVAQTEVTKSLAGPLGEAAKAAIKTSATATADLTGGSGSNQSIPTHVSDAVADITKVALMQDYSGQICAEALRGRGEGLGLAKTGSAFLGFCRDLFAQLVADRAALTKSAIDSSQADDHARRMLADAVRLTAQKLPQNASPEQIAELIKLMAVAAGSVDGGSNAAPSVAIRVAE